MRFLFCGIDPQIAQALDLHLSLTPHVALFAETLDDAHNYIRDTDIDAAMLDAEWELGAAIGFARTLRLNHTDTPLLLITAEANPDATVARWLETFDDVVRAPVSIIVAVARLEAIARRRLGTSDSVIRLGDVEANLSSNAVTFAGEPVRLTLTEYRLFHALVKRPGVMVSKGAIMDVLYPHGKEPEIKIVDVLVCKLRKKFTQAGAAPDFVKTVWGRGYIVDKPRVAA